MHHPSSFHSNRKPSAPDAIRVGSAWTTVLLTRFHQARGGAGPGGRDDLAAGQRLGHFRLLRRLGRGAHGEVWKAAPADRAAAAVALKVLAGPAGDGPRLRSRLRWEMELTARVQAPALLPALEAGDHLGTAFLVMPWVDGYSFGEVIAQRRRRLGGQVPQPGHWRAALSERSFTRSAVRIVERVARALQALHDARVAHRDVKPANVLLHRYCGDRVFLCDFGLSLDVGGSAADSSRDSSGTLIYMAPEKLLGHDADETRCDVYSLGATLFEAVTLSPPFSIAEGLSWFRLRTYLASLPLPRPRDLRPDVPSALERIILKAMDPDPAGRHASAAGLADALDRWLATADRETA